MHQCTSALISWTLESGLQLSLQPKCSATRNTQLFLPFSLNLAPFRKFPVRETMDIYQRFLLLLPDISVRLRVPVEFTTGILIKSRCGKA